jgi:hypothetical protein
MTNRAGPGSWPPQCLPAESGRVPGLLRGPFPSRAGLRASSVPPSRTGSGSGPPPCPLSPAGSGSGLPPCLSPEPSRVQGTLPNRAGFRTSSGAPSRPGPGSGYPPGDLPEPGRVQGLLRAPLPSRAGFRAPSGAPSGQGSGPPPCHLPGRAAFRAGTESGPPSRAGPSSGLIRASLKLRTPKSQPQKGGRGSPPRADAAPPPQVPSDAAGPGSDETVGARPEVSVHG